VQAWFKNRGQLGQRAQGWHTQTFVERSRFLREGGKWLYGEAAAGAVEHSVRQSLLQRGGGHTKACRQVHASDASTHLQSTESKTGSGDDCTSQQEAGEGPICRWRCCDQVAFKRLIDMHDAEIIHVIKAQLIAGSRGGDL
jgi:hypothetical protein